MEFKSQIVSPTWHAYIEQNLIFISCKKDLAKVTFVRDDMLCVM